MRELSERVKLKELSERSYSLHSRSQHRLSTENSRGLSTENSRGLSTENSRGLSKENIRGLSKENSRGLSTENSRGLSTENSRGLSTRHKLSPELTGEETREKKILGEVSTSVSKPVKRSGVDITAPHDHLLLQYLQSLVRVDSGVS